MAPGPILASGYGLQAIFSELVGEIRELKGQMIMFLGDDAASSNGILASRTAAKDFTCKHCRSSSHELGDERTLESEDEWSYDLDYLSSP